MPKAPSNRASQDGNRLFFIHLRQKEKRNDPRTDPKYERGNFGTTGCHGANLMAPHRIEDRLKPGDRIAFLQGGMSRDPSVSTIKIAFLTPPLSTVRPVIINCEDREVERGVIEWEPQWDHMRKRPLRFRYQLDLLDRPAELEFTPAERMMLACINDTILTAKRRKKAARISSCMRSLCRGIPIDSKNARTVIDRYEEHVKEMSSRYSSNAFVRCDSEAHTDTTAMLLRVGIDTGTDGALAPIFEDGSFEYIPISESDPSSCETRTFKNTIGRSGHPLSTYLPKKIETRTIHFDPEFDTLTYGDPTVKSRYLRSLVRGDLLVFYAGLMPYENTSQKRGLYIIGYFMVDEILDFKGMTDAERVKCRRRFPNNAHMKRADEVDELVIVVGKRRKSRLLDKAVLISQPKADRRGRPYMALSDEMEGMLGVSGGIQRSIPPRFIRGQKYLESLRQILHYN